MVEYFSIVDFIKDRNDMTFDPFKNKYDNKIPSNVTIAKSINELKKTNSIKLIIDQHWYGDTRDKHVHYLISTNNKYEVFISERNGKHCLEIFEDFEKAVFVKLDALFNEMNFAADDSKINA